LTSIQVKLRSVDEFSPFLYPSRTVELKTPRGSILTPLRAATSYEYKAKMRTPTAAPIDSPVLINVKKLTPHDLRSLITKNESFGELLRKIGMSNRVGQYANIRLALIQPTRTTYEEGEVSSMKILQQSISARERFLRFVVRLHQEAGMDIVTIPFIQLPYSTLRKTISDLHKNLRRLGAEPVFFVDLAYKEFESVIRLLVDDLESNLVGIIHRRYADQPIHYDFLRSYYNHDVAFLSVETSRFDENLDDISTMHYLPFLGNDVYAVRVPLPFHDESETQKLSGQSESKLGKVRFFDRETLKVKPAGLLDTERILSDIKYQDPDIIRRMLDNRSEVNEDNKKFQVLNSFSKLHELNTSLLEFGDFRERIRKNETNDYIDTKGALKPLLALAQKRKTLDDKYS
jgi:hypothetical protein